MAGTPIQLSTSEPDCEKNSDSEISKSLEICLLIRVSGVALWH